MALQRSEVRGGALRLLAARQERDTREIGGPGSQHPDRRGGHVTVNHPAMREVTAALWEQDVIPDYRDPNGLRIGLSPLSTSFEEVWRGMSAVRDVLGELTHD